MTHHTFIHFAGFIGAVNHACCPPPQVAQISCSTVRISCNVITKLDSCRCYSNLPILNKVCHDQDQVLQMSFEEHGPLYLEAGMGSLLCGHM